MLAGVIAHHATKQYRHLGAAPFCGVCWRCKHLLDQGVHFGSERLLQLAQSIVLYALRYIGNELPAFFRAKVNSPLVLRGERFIIKPPAFSVPYLGEPHDLVIVSSPQLVLFEDFLFQLQESGVLIVQWACWFGGGPCRRGCPPPPKPATRTPARRVCEERAPA